MAANTNPNKVDQALLTALINAGVGEDDGEELARFDTFGGQDTGRFIVGFRAAATLMCGGHSSLDWMALPSPWNTVCPMIASANGKGPGIALYEAVDCYETTLQGALMNAISALAGLISAQTTKAQSTNTTGGMSPQQAAVAQQGTELLKPIDANLVRHIQKILSANKPLAQKRKQAGEYLIDWLARNGKFIRTVYGQHYYLYAATRKLFSLETSLWQSFVYLLSGVNPASTDARFFYADCETAAQHNGEELEVVRVAHWDTEQKTLRVSRFDGRVYRLDGLTIEEESNGDGPVLFDDAMYWQSYKPDFSAKGSVLNWTMYELPNWEDHREETSLLFRNWWLGTFFTELCPTRPILVIKGEKGSGKTMGLRIVLRSMFGNAVDVAGIPDRADGFTALTSNNHIAVLDNLDEMAKEIRDKIASISTGKLDQLRKLFTTNEMYTIRYRCWLAVTSRTPDTLQREDLVDRVIILPVHRIEDGNRVREAQYLREAQQKRNQWWGDCLTALNSVVAEIRRNGLPDRGGLRMEDWAALGEGMSRAAGQVDIWGNGIKLVKTRQAHFLLEDEVIVQGIETWLSSQQYTSAPLTTRSLYEDVKAALFGVDRPDSTWPRSVRAFGRRLAGIRPELTGHLAKSKVTMLTGVLHGYETYQFLK